MLLEKKYIHLKDALLARSPSPVSVGKWVTAMGVAAATVLSWGRASDLIVSSS